MVKIGVISDTHGTIDRKITHALSVCDEIWHAGDIGNIETADILEGTCVLRAVHGNMDGQDVRMRYPSHQRFFCEEVDVWITHIGGYPGNYAYGVREEIRKNPPKLFISGHSHILKVMYDKKLELLHINPGAAGKSGLHRVRTVVRFVIDGKDIRDLEVVEMEKR